jgi:hypothetical protein
MAHNWTAGDSKQFKRGRSDNNELYLTNNFSLVFQLLATFKSLYNILLKSNDVLDQHLIPSMHKLAIISADDGWHWFAANSLNSSKQTKIPIS